MRPLMPPVQTPDNLFHDGNPLTGELGTIVDAEHLNNEQAAIRDTQSELIAILTAAAMEPESTAGQLLSALNKLYAPLNDTLGALSNLVGGANKLPYFTAANAAALTALSSIGRDIIGKATVADILTYLGLNLFIQLSNQTRMDSPGKTYSLAVMDNDWGVWLSGTGTRVPLSMEAGGTGSGTPAGARQALGLKGAAVLDVGKVAGSVAAGDDSRITGAMQKSALGSDIPDKGSFQNNLGLSFNGTINSFTSKGPGLLIKQGGKVTAPNGTGNSLVIDFPIAFPNGCVDAFAIFEDGVPNQTPFEISIVPENTKMTVYILSTGGTIYFNNRSLRWSAEGF